MFGDALPDRWRARVRLDGIGGTLCIPCGADADAVSHRLAGLGARHDRRGDVLRLSFHLCNTSGHARAVAGAFA